MPETAIVTDSVACLTKDLFEQYVIDIIPLTVLVGGKVYRDWLDISPSHVYELVAADPDSFKTAPATPEECLEIFRKASQKANNINVSPSQPGSVRFFKWQWLLKKGPGWLFRE